MPAGGRRSGVDDVGELESDIELTGGVVVAVRGLSDASEQGDVGELESGTELAGGVVVAVRELADASEHGDVGELDSDRKLAGGVVVAVGDLADAGEHFDVGELESDSELVGGGESSTTLVSIIGSTTGVSGSRLSSRGNCEQEWLQMKAEAESNCDAVIVDCEPRASTAAICSRGPDR